MIRISNIRMELDHTQSDLRQKLLSKLKIQETDLIRYVISKRSIDARKRDRIRFLYAVDVKVRGEQNLLKRFSSSKEIRKAPDTNYSILTCKQPKFRPVVVGAGPCGLFAGLILAEMGFNPLLLERGKPVEERINDVNRFWSTGALNPKSNAQFGEGGAGAFSDGKLTTQIKDPHNRCKKVLQEMVLAGAPEEILYVNKPHVGTDKLRSIVRNLRNKIISLGGEVRFESQVTGLKIRDNQIRGAFLANHDFIPTKALVLAIGHSARDTFHMLHDLGVPLKAKPFSIGLRIEHHQRMINQSQYGKWAENPNLGPADYKLAHHCSNKRSVYTFCMCPGGHVINASSEEDGLVVNGMSLYARNSKNANSAILVGVKPEDFGGSSPLEGVEFQRLYERKAFQLGGADHSAPVQRVEDFLRGRPSSGHGPIEPTFKPNVRFCDLHPCLPPYASMALKEAIPAFDRKIRGFATPDALLIGVETRSSSPVRIVRNDVFESIHVEGLYPSGEGAGYAGGIISSAVDGVKTAEAIAQKTISL